jgi:hypothetical protein
MLLSRVTAPTRRAPPLWLWLWLRLVVLNPAPFDRATLFGHIIAAPGLLPAAFQRTDPQPVAPMDWRRGASGRTPGIDVMVRLYRFTFGNGGVVDSAYV